MSFAFLAIVFLISGTKSNIFLHTLDDLVASAALKHKFSEISAYFHNLFLSDPLGVEFIDIALGND